MADRSFPFHRESSGPANAPVEKVFAFLKEPKALAADTGKSSMMMLGSHTSIHVDAGGVGGRVIGSKVRMRGRMLDVRLSLEEVITKRRVPAMEVVETIRTPKLVVISHYRMGFDLTRIVASWLVHVFIHYSLPNKPPGTWLDRLLGAFYARSCTRQMVMGAARHSN